MIVSIFANSSFCDEKTELHLLVCLRTCIIVELEVIVV